MDVKAHNRTLLAMDWPPQRQDNNSTEASCNVFDRGLNKRQAALTEEL